MRVTLAILLGKLVGWLSRATGRGGGTSLPGRVALRVCPGLDARLAASLRRGVIVVTGTNGKTTTCKMVAAILRRAGFQVVRNVSGANLRQGLTTTLLAAAGLGGRIGADYALLEVDEAAVAHALRPLRPIALLVSNLFRDQLDRYGELSTTAQRLAESIAADLPDDALLVLNADDPLVASLADMGSGRPVFYGIDCVARGLTEADHASDSHECPGCGTPLTYQIRYGAHLGLWRCEGCGRSRPSPDLTVAEAALQADLTERVRLVAARADGASATSADALEASLKLPGLYNVANAAAAAALTLALGVDPPRVREGLESTSAAFGRLERVGMPDGKTAVLMLVKNPAGLNEVTRLIVESGEPRPAMIALTDEIADGRDVSWIWDADLERLDGRVGRVVVSGVRAHDMALRLKYAGMDMGSVEIIADTRAALARALDLAPAGGQVYVLPTYTAMLDLRARLHAEGLVPAFWEELE
jgi:UDP-N-acetylmuramyl tripeptide synthase